MVLVLPAGHFQADLTDDGLRDDDIDAVDARQVDAADAVELSPRVDPVADRISVRRETT